MTDLTTVVRPSRLPLAGLIVLSLAVAVVAAFVVSLLLHADSGDRQRTELACQVQRLGGKPIGGVNCPSKKASPRPAVTATTQPRPAPSVLVVVPYPQASPAPGRGGAPRPATASPAARPTASASASALPSPSPSCTVRAPVTGTCVVLPPRRRRT